MAAIITSKFRLNNAEQFTESFSESAPTAYYLFIGRSSTWQTDVDVQGNTVVEGTDSTPPTPNDDVSSEFYNYDEILGLKKIASSDVSQVIPKRTWTTGTTYDMYEHNISASNTSNSGATNLFDAAFYVINSANNVYKVIENDGNTASTSEPTSTSNSIFSTADGYRWKYMYSLSTTQVTNFVSTDFMPVSTNSTVSAAAVNGALDTILVAAGGSSYDVSGGGTSGTITAVPIRGDGSGGVASVVLTSGAITSATITTAGTNYTYAYIRNADIIAATNAGGNGSGGNLNVIIPPKGGHGKDSPKELGGFFVMLNTDLSGSEGTSDILATNDFRTVGIVRDPTNFGTSTVSSGTTLRGISAIKIASSPTPGTFTIDEEINQASTGAVGRVVSWDSTNKILYYCQTRFPDYGTDANGNKTAFSGNNVITGQSSSATATPDVSSSATVNAVVFASGYSNPEIQPDSGDIIYVEHRSPISRASDQTENIKLIIEF
tara:strand:+ start:235 stop:1707 length:1473 start_codon:yes stop_codon:yes gene_type:complete